MTKATTAEGDQMKHGPNWLMSRRAMLEVYDDRLECGDWTVPYASIEEATLLSVWTLLVFVPFPTYVLRVKVSDKTYHFGLNPGPFWKGDLPFAVKREKGRLRMSPFSLVLRVGVAAWLIYLLVKWLLQS